MSTLLCLALATAVGFPVALAIAPELRRGLLVGAALLVGVAVPPLVLAVLSVIGVRWSSLAVTTAVVAVGLMALLVARRRRIPSAPEERQRSSVLSVAFDAITAFALSGYALFALSGPSPETDYVTIWGLKGLRFFHAGGIDLEFLERGWNAFSHPDYPLLLPLIFDWPAVATGVWQDRWFGAIFVLFGLAGVLVARAMLEEELGPPAAALTTAALVPTAVAPYLGLAEGPLIAFATAGALFVRRGINRRLGSNVTLGAVFLGLAASTKNEGLTFVICTVLAAAVAFGYRNVQRMWPAVLIPLPWLVIRHFHGLTTDLAAGDVLSRFYGHLRNADEILLTIGSTPLGKPFFWLGLLLALLVGGSAVARRERFLLLAIALQCLFYVGAYFVTPHDIEWHVRWSWERVLNQMTMLLAFVAATTAMLEVAGPREEPREL